MVPIGIRHVFRNRWWTLAWAIGICWTAVNVSGGSDGDAVANGADLNGAVAALDIR